MGVYGAYKERLYRVMFRVGMAQFILGLGVEFMVQSLRFRIRA